MIALVFLIRTYPPEGVPVEILVKFTEITEFLNQLHGLGDFNLVQPSLKQDFESDNFGWRPHKAPTMRCDATLLCLVC